LLVVAWAGFDLYGPRHSSLRDFDPTQVTRLETDIWRAYYAKQRLRLFAQLAELMRTQYHFPYVRSNAVAYQPPKPRSSSGGSQPLRLRNPRMKKVTATSV
jgi:hypothetical protein